MSAPKRVAVIGAGVSGVGSVKICRDFGFEVVCYERNTGVGGLWNVQNPFPSHIDQAARVYKNLYMNSSKPFYTYSDFESLQEHPYYLNPECLMEYVRAYMKKFEIEKYFSFGRNVDEVMKAPDYARTGRWLVKTSDAVTKSDEKTEVFDAVFSCTGYYSKARLPEPYPGQERFKGSMIHSGKYWDPVPYKGRRVLLVGGSISCIDIASILAAGGAEHVYVLMREGMWVLPQVFSNSLSWEDFFFDRAMWENSEFREVQKKAEEFLAARFDHGALGLAPDRPVLQGRMAISDDIDKWIMSGLVTPVKDHIVSFTENCVQLKSGREIEVDDVIWATGYELQVPHLKDPLLNPGETPQSKWWMYTYPVEQEHPTFWLIGMFYVFSAMAPVAEMTARVACRVLQGDIELPTKEDMLKRIEEEKEQALEIFGRFPGLDRDGMSYLLEMSKWADCFPDIEKIAEKSPKVAEMASSGPLYPPYFRLLGTHAKWDTAEQILSRIPETRHARTRDPSWTIPQPFSMDKDH